MTSVNTDFDTLQRAGDGSLFSPTSPRNPFRRQRMASVVRMTAAIIEAKGDCHILDLGGTPEYWLVNEHLWKDLPLKITILNTMEQRGGTSKLAFLRGDARDLVGIADGSFDLVHSNSVIEHVGTWADMRAMAEEVRRVGRAYFVQTPYVGFPIEPHFRLPFFHWLPTPVQISIVMARRTGFFEKADTVDAAMSHLEDARLLGRRQMTALFPDADIAFERVMGFRKSMVASRPWLQR